MSELFRRSITGIFYVIVILLCIWFGFWTFSLLILCLGLVCIYEFHSIVGSRGIGSYLTFIFLWAAALFLDWDIIIYGLLLFCLIANLSFSLGLFSSSSPYARSYRHWLLVWSYLIGGLVFLCLIPLSRSQEFDGILIFTVFSFIWINDTMAYLVGKRFGKTKLFPSVSPKKTIEGLAGGGVSVVGISLIWSSVASISLGNSLVIAFSVVIFGSLGDLVESKFKRIAQVKDSSQLLPGHGGVLDRLDSIIFVAPFLYFIFQII